MAEQDVLHSPTALQAPNNPQSPPAVGNTFQQSGIATQHQRTIGGFLVDDDEDDVVQVQSASSAAPGTATSDFLNTNQDQSSSVFSTSLQSPRATRPSSSSHFTSDVAAFNTSGTPQLAADALTPDLISSAAASTINGLANGLSGESDNAAGYAAGNVSQIEPAAAAAVQARLPNDRIGMFEDRIKDDPLGDTDAWFGLINEYKKRNKVEDVRSTYTRFFALFPTEADQYTAYASWELENNNFYQAEQIFNTTLRNVTDLKLWTMYLNYIRRRFSLTNDPKGDHRKVCASAFDFVLKGVGQDKDAGPLWQEYIAFIRAGPGQPGGASWEDQQKMDELRKALQRAICVPTQSTNTLWNEYSNFEMGLNKMTGRKFLHEKSPSYMTARSSYTALQNITKELKRNSLPVLPPAVGFEGDEEFAKQVELWKKWIEWEKDDPLVLKDDDAEAYKQRVLYVFKQALLPMRFLPQLWYDAAEFCFEQGLSDDGNEFLEKGAIANPESPLLAFARGERIESTTQHQDDEESLKRRGDAVRAPYDNALNALYRLLTTTKERASKDVAKIREAASTSARQQGGDNENAEEARIEAAVNAVNVDAQNRAKLLSRTISFVWIALMRAMRRVQGKGKPGDVIGGFRQVFAEARKRGHLSSDVYVVSALIEYHCYKDPAATKIFERGAKLFPDDEQYALEYLKHLVAINDVTNARAVFETTVGRLTSKADGVKRSKPLYAFFHEFESNYGELNQIKKLEQRMRELFPEDPALALLSKRNSSADFDPTTVRIIVSPTQTRPKGSASRSSDSAGAGLGAGDKPTPTTSLSNSPRPAMAAAAVAAGLSSGNSPKRGLPTDESDSESLPARKIPRGESPLKGAAGRRLDAKRSQLRSELAVSQAASTPMSMPLSLPTAQGQAPQGLVGPPPPLPAAAPLPPQIDYLLRILPRREFYETTTFDPVRSVEFLRRLDLSGARGGAQQAQQQQQQHQQSHVAPLPMGQVAGQGQGQMYGYGIPGAGRMF